MKRVLLLTFIWVSFEATAQTTRLEDLCQIFHLPDGKDTTTFIVFGSKDDLKIKKPLFLFRQGSLPTPFILSDSGKYYLLTPFSFRDYIKEYHFVVVQKPGVRLIATQPFMDAYQNRNRDTATNKQFFSRQYLVNNYRERYVDQCDKVIDYLIKQQWIDSKRVVYCGGSEGFTVGADLVANRNKHITHTILSSGKQGRRFEAMIHQMREQIERGEITPEEGQKEIEKIYLVWEDICKNPTAVDKSFGDTYRAWYSFS